jgi:hypothetical protein
MTFNPHVITSIHGKRVGLNSTGALIVDHSGTKYAAVTKSSADALQGSSAFVYAGQGILTAQTAIPANASGVFTNYGRQSLSSASATSINATAAVTTLQIAVPQAGIEKEILIDTSASEITLGNEGASTATVFASTVAAAAGSSLFLSKANLAGTVIKLRGVSTTQWSIIGSTAGMTVG